MCVFNIKIAEIVIEIESKYDRALNYCNEYLSNKEPDLKICVSLEDIKKAKIEYENIYPQSERLDSYYEILAIHTKIVEKLLDYNIVLMHGSVVATDINSCYMFTAPSGTGKTTHTKLWIKKLPDSFVVNGDKPLIKIDNNQIIACGTPWAGKERWSKNVNIPLKGICILERGEKNSIKEISFKEAFLLLLQEVYWPSNSVNMKKTVALLSKFNKNIKFYKMQVNNFADDAFDTSYNVMVK